jgi:hypothetical protein
MIRYWTFWATWAILSYSLGYDISQWQWWCLSAMVMAAHIQGNLQSPYSKKQQEE